MTTQISFPMFPDADDCTDKDEWVLQLLITDIEKGEMAKGKLKAYELAYFEGASNE